MKMIMRQVLLVLVLFMTDVAKALIEQQPIFTLQPFDVGPLFSGARGILQCTASGTPTISYKWLKDGHLIDRPGNANGGVYLISQADRFNDVGSYQCVAENKLGAVLSNQAQLTVAYMDQLRTSYPTEIRVKKGRAAVIRMPSMYDAYPRPTIEWFAGGALIEPNAKFAITKDFNLVVLRADKADEKSYYVEASSIHTGTKIRSKEIRLIVSDDEPTGSSIYSSDGGYNDNFFNPYASGYGFESEMEQEVDLEFVVKPEDTTAKLNENLVKFDCIVNSRRAPLDQLEINWYKDSVLIDFIKTKYHLSARSLEIISVTDQDAGVYSCSVKYNYLGSGGYSSIDSRQVHLNASAKLDVYIKPTFMKQPENLIETDFGKTVTITCSGLSNPAANITWYKNAKLIDLRRQTNIEVSGDNSQLTISNVAKDDQGIYQCFLTNHAGSINAATLLKIISFAPKFSQPIQNMTLYSDSNAVLSCGEVDGSPKPKITWSKLDSYDFEPTILQPQTSSSSYNNRFAFNPMPNSYFISNGNLIINSVSQKSLGWYKCEASNLLGSISAKMFLQIKRKTEIIEPPMNISVTKGQSAVFKCTVSKEDDVDIELKWTFNNIPLDLTPIDLAAASMIDEHSNLKLYKNGTLQIMEARNTDIGLYECHVTSIRNNPAGNDSRTAYLNVVELPYAPTNLQASLNSNQTRSVKVSWQPSFDGNSEIVKYIIQARITTSFDLLLLQQQQQYEQSQQMSSMSNSQHEWFVIKDNVYASVLEKIGVSRSGNSVKYWTFINDLKPALSYEFKVSAINGIGEGMPSRASNNVTIPEEVPSQAPQNLQASSINSKSLTLNWQLPIMQSWNGRLKGYRIAYSLSYPNSTWKYSLISDPTLTTGNLTDLIVWEIYLIKICAYNSKGFGKYSEPIRVRTKEGIPIRAPVNFIANPTNSTCINMAWSAPPAQFVNGIIQGYKLVYQEKVNFTRHTHVIGSHLLKQARTMYGRNNNDQLEYSLCGLDKFTTYSFSILCFTSSGDGPATQPIQLRTLEDKPGEISYISFNNVYDTSLDIEWQPPVHPNGKILSYIIQYRPLVAKSNSTKNKFEQVILDASQHVYTLKNLQQSTEYYIGIKAKTKAGDGQIKYTQIKSGVPPELPEPPKAIVLRTIGNTFVELEFIPGYSGKTSISRWIVEALIVMDSEDYQNYINYSSLNNNANSTSSYFKWHRIYERSNAPNATKLTVDNLKPFTNYTLRMYSQNVKGISGPSVPTELFQTKSDVPSVSPEYLGARLHTLYADTSKPADINVTIKWSPIPTSTWNGIPHGYVLQVKECGTQWPPNNRTIRIAFNQLKQTVYQLHGLKSFQCYEIRMCAWNSVGFGPWTKPNNILKINRTSESRPSIAPASVNLFSINASCIKVVWQRLKPASELTNGVLIGYKIKYTAEHSSHSNDIFVENELESVSVDNTNKKMNLVSTQQVFIHRLLSFTNYHVEIAGCTRAGCGVYSSPVSLRTNEYLSSEPVNLHFPFVNLTSVQLAWLAPVHPNGALSTYRVRYILKRQLNVNKPDSEQKWSVLYVPHNATKSEYTAGIVGLAKMEYYVFEVSANNTSDMGWGQTGTSIVYTIDRRAAPEPPSQPVIGKSSIKADELTISWSPGPDNYGPVRFFSVQVMEMQADRKGLANVTDWRYAVEKFYVDSTRSSYMLKISGNDLTGKPLLESNGHIYQFRITATNDVGTSLPSQKSEPIRTKNTAPRNKPLALHATPLTSSLLKLTWYEQINTQDRFSNDFLIKFKLVYRQVLLPDAQNSIELELEHKATRRQLIRANSPEITDDQAALLHQIGNQYSLLKHEHFLDNRFSPNGVYEIKLCGINQIGLGECSHTESLVYMEDTLPTIIRTNGNVSTSVRHIVSARTLSSTELNLTWIPPNKDLINGRLYAYKIVYFVSDSENEADIKQTGAVGPFQKFMQNKNLIYEIKKYLNESDSMVTRNKRAEIGVAYRKSKEIFNSIIVEPTATSILINNLKPFTQYSLFIQLINQAGESVSPLEYILSNNSSLALRSDTYARQLVTAQTFQSIPSRPAKLIFSYVSYTFLNITWLKPESPNGKLISYEVLYENIPDKQASLHGTSFKTIIHQEITTGLDQPFHTLHIPNLAPNVKYLFKVRCRTSVNWGQYIERSIRTGPQNKEIQLTTDQGILRGHRDKIGSPLAPSIPMFTDLNDTHAMLEWKPYSDSHEIFIVEIKYFYISPDSINSDSYQLLDEATLVTSVSSTRTPSGASGQSNVSVDLNSFKLFAYTNQTRLLINKQEQLTAALFMFRVFSFNFIGISEPSPNSELVHIKSVSDLPFASKTDGSFFYSNWWFLVIIALSSVTLVIMIILIMCLRGKNKKFLLKRDKKLRNTMRMMKMNKMNQGGQPGPGGVDPNKTSTMQTNLRLETLLDNLTGTDSIDLSMHDNLGHYLTSGRSNKHMGGANSNYYMGGSNAQLILTDTTNCGDSTYGVSQHHQLVYDMRKSKQGGAPGTMRTATYCSPNGTLSRFNVLTNNNNNGFENDAETERNGSGTQAAGTASNVNTLGKQQQLNPRNLNGILNGFFQHQAQPNDYSSSGHIGQIINQNGQFNTVKSNKGNGNHYLLPSSNQAFDQADQAEPANEESPALNSTEIAAPQAGSASAAPTPAQFYYGQQNYASFNANNNQALLRQTATNQSVRGPHALSNIYSDEATATQAMNNLPSVIYERDCANNYSNRKIYTTSSFGRQPETPQAQPKNVIPPTLQKQQQQFQLQQQQQQQQSLISSTDSNNFYGRRGAESGGNNNYASNRDMTMTRQLNMNTYYERNQVYQIHQQQQQQPTYHTHMEAVQQFQPPALPSQPAPELPTRQMTPPPPPPPPEPAASNVRAPPVVPIMPPQVPQLPKNLPPSRPLPQMTQLIQTPPPPPLPTNRPPTYQQTNHSEGSEASSSAGNNPSSNISISLKSGDRVIMNNTAGSRKPLSGFQSFV